MDNNRWPFCLAEGLGEEMKSDLWQQAVAYVHNNFDTNSRDVVMVETDKRYAGLVKAYKLDS